VWVLWSDLGGGHLAGDLIELFSALLIALNIALMKRLCYKMDKWKVLLWRFIIAEALFLILAFSTGIPHPGSVSADAWLAVAFQALVVSIFCFASFQVLLERHNSSQVTVFFFATPFFGALFGVVLLGEPFDLNLLWGNIFVATGILLTVRGRDARTRARPPLLGSQQPG